jgi:hypothetical protein
VTRPPNIVRPGVWAWARVRSWSGDRVNLALSAVFVAGAAFYLWTAGTSTPFSFDKGGIDRYNTLASAFLHLRLWVAEAPAGLLRLAEPYNPRQNAPFVDTGGFDAANFHDDVLYGGHLFFLWGPAPALVLLVPLHLLGLEPSASVTVAFFAVVGLGFALGTLRVLLRQVGDTPLWICVLAGSALALCSTMPFLLRTPSVTEDTLAGGFCFTMAGVWLAASAVADRGASLRRLALMSLCFGLAAGSRPPLAVAAVVLVPVWLSLRSTRPRRGLTAALAVPVGLCVVLLLAYNQARFGAPLDFGAHRQLAGFNALHAHLGSLAAVPPSAWFYLLYPPRPTALFPFIVLGPPPLSYPGILPPGYSPELTGGLLPMTPIVVFLPALLWIWRRRPTWLGPLASLSTVSAGAGVAVLVLMSYEQNFGPTERYEVEFSALLLLGALAAWLALSAGTRGNVRRLVRLGGGLLAAWGCVTGFAVGFIGYGDFLAVEHPGTWAALQDAGSPLSAVLARVVGHPLLAETLTKHVNEYTPVHFTSLTMHEEESFWLEAGERADFAIVSPDARTAALALEMSAGVEAEGVISPGGGTVGVTFLSGARPPATYYIPPGFAVLRIPVRLVPGVNRFEMRPLAGTFRLPDREHPRAISELVVTKVSLENNF